MPVDLGFMKIPLEGPFNFAIATGGIVWGCLVTTVVFSVVDMKGPAIYKLTSPEVIDACGKTMVVTALWCFLYYNYVAIQVGTVFAINAFEMYAKDDVTDKMVPNSARFAGNMFEQSAVFLTCLWAYTLLVDYETGGYLGYLYIIRLLLYPWCYMICRQFTMWFEYVTQVGYGVCGVFMLGIFVNGLGGGHKWIDFAHNKPVPAAILGFFVGSLGIFPFGNPVSLIYHFVHYKFDRAYKAKTEKTVTPV